MGVKEDSVAFSDGDFIFREGEQSNEMYVVQEGRVRITRHTKKDEIVLANLEKGDFLGEMSLLESLPRSANAIAVGKVRLLRIQPGGFLLKIRRDPTFAFELMQALSKRIRCTNEQLMNGLASGSTEDAVKRVLEGNT